MPDNIIETSGYLAHRRYCINNLENILRSYAKAVDIITSPTLRDSIYYSHVLNVPNVFTIYNVYDVFPEHFTDGYILGRKIMDQYAFPQDLGVMNLSLNL